MKRKTPITGLAALTASLDEQSYLAACSVELSLNETGTQQLMPAGRFTTIDGQSDKPQSGYFYIDEAIAKNVIEERQSLKRDLLFDYEHQTLYTKDNGKEAPAAGWAKSAHLSYDHVNGLLVSGIDWTPKARQMIKDKEYRYLSPVFSYNKMTGEVISLKHLAITNEPAVDGMQDLVALKQSKSETTKTTQTTQPENAMHPLLIQLLAKIGIKADANMDMAALKAQLDKKEAETGLAALTACLESAKNKDTEIAALKAQNERQGNEVDISQFVPIETYNGVITEMAALKAGHDKVTVDSLIDKAKDDGRFINEAEVGYLKKLGNSNIAALKATLNARPVVEALNGKQTAHSTPPDAEDNVGKAALTVEQKKFADQCGISHEKFAQQLKIDTAGD
jgi:phage I-like protein